LRIGFVAAPAAWIEKIERAIRATTWNTPALMTTIACTWLDDGTVDRLEAEKRLDAMARQAIAADVLRGLEMVRHPSSYFVWLPLGDDVRADSVVKALRQQHIYVSTADPFATTAQVPHALRLALGSVEPDALRSALKVVRRVIDVHSF
jgi:DNA-binding transcriptional MocR family regulator